MARQIILAALVILVSVLHQGWASRILAICPTPSISHQVVFRGLTMALRDRGHELVVVTTDPVNDPALKNYTEININFLYRDFMGEVDWVANRKNKVWFDIITSWISQYTSQTDRVLNLPELRSLYAPDSGQKFDLLLIETLYWPTFLSFGQRFDVPIIGITSLALPANVQYEIGNAILSSHPSNWDCGATVLGKLTLWQRLKNFVKTWRYLYWYRTDFMPANQAIARKYFGNNVPDLRDLEKNISLIFVNQQAPISHVRPNIPKIIEIGGFHVSKQVKPLSKDLERILDNATQGFIYMSLGSNVKSAMLSDKIRGEFIATFSKLPYTIIWKFEDEFLPGRPDNVVVMKWAPQQSILAHPNIKAFIYQGGLQSTEEAISHGVPVIGLPVLADQDTIIDKMSSLGVGKKLEILNFNSEDLLDAIYSVVQDGSYKQRMLNLRDLIRDKPYDSLDNAVWWTEHVIRHKGAPHLHSTTADEPWYQRQDMDLIFLISAGFLTAFSLILVVLYELSVYSIRVFKYQIAASKKDKLRKPVIELINIPFDASDCTSAHPNLKVFIYQGGLQSTEEAVSHAVPVIGLPVFCDQESNVDKIVSLGVGKKLDIFSVDRFDLMEAIHSIVRDDSYKRSMLKLRDLIRDAPYDLMKNAVWWTEHAIRHKGAPHLHSTTTDDHWYQRHDMDLIFLISAGFLTTLGSILVVLYKLLLYSVRVFKYQIAAIKKDKVQVCGVRCWWCVEDANVMARKVILAAFVVLVCALHPGWASRILAICPTPSISHQIVFRRLTMALRERGHELVVVTTDPVDDPALKNYTEINIDFLYRDFLGKVDWVAQRRNKAWFDTVIEWSDRGKLHTERILNLPELMSLYAPNSGQRFDLLLIEMLYWPTFLSFGQRFDVPIIGITSLALPANVQYGIGSPILSSHPSNWDCGATVVGKLSLWQRVKNFVKTWRFLYWYMTDFMPANQAIARKYFGNNLPDLRDLERNISLIFVNQHAPITYVRPNTPKIIDIGGFHVSEQVKPLSKNLQKILDEATQGFIYMSLGSNVKSALLSDEIRGEFVTTFSKLPYTVIWKFENEFLPGQPDNVIIMKWAPQQSILAHPNIKAFIYQGGLQSTEEAIAHRVPVIGLPVFVDQDSIIDKMSSLGVGKKLEILNFNSEDLLDAIHSVVQNGGYKQRMLKLRDLMRDKPYNSLENAVWWTEHVIRHKGAPHLHSTTADDPWYQRQDMDLIFLISAGFLTALSLILVVLYRILVNSIRVLKYSQLLVSRKKKVY
ncbi:uncharacterized protein LOC124414463 [Diprion similis]|uniref:uncharacterized protein LOC124414463 n=1 Tax=Diprion similis TaxID=362088 RepID=UPI001EF944FB|nr:uncharacterized protein LOC124414463 [Diprion similis]